MMVKKIRVIEEPTVDEITEEEFRKNIMEIAKSADWKLWELLQTMQRLEKKLSVIDPDADDDD
jgi:Fe-S cluster biosynthesis and repair protein YggX